MTDVTSGLTDRLRERQQVLRSRGLGRDLRVRTAAEDVIDFAGNDYLGLSTEPRVTLAASEAARQWGAGATGSRLVTGTTELHNDLERLLSRLLGTESAMVFSSGYLANLGVVSAIADPGTLVVIDAHAHASLFDAGRLSRGEVIVVPHNDVTQLSQELRRKTHPRAMVVTESVFSVDGDCAPLVDIADACRTQDAVLVVDEAHAVGTLGTGRGLLCELGLAGQEQIVVTATLSKALGSQGGVVAAGAGIRDFLVNRARTFIYDTALAPPAVAAAKAAAQIVLDEPSRVSQLRQRVAMVAQRLGARLPDGAVLSVPVDTPDDAVRVAEEAASRGVLVGAFRPPSVPDDRSRIRITVRADLSEEQVTHGCDVLVRALAGAS